MRLALPPSIVVRSALATAARAIVHDVSVRRDPSPRTCGTVTRSVEFTASKLKRPRSHNQPQLTEEDDPESTPRWRTRWSRLDCTVIRQPTEHVVHVVSDSARSHGRALKRNGVAVSAPTGQICTVLPEKYELNGRSGNVITCVSLPRATKWMRASPATSSAKRVHRSHRMHRSRSSSTSELIGIGFSKWRFSSM